MKATVASLILFAASLAHAANFRVTVGASGLVFNPTTVMANANDTIEFVFTGVLLIPSFSFKMEIYTGRHTMLPRLILPLLAVTRAGVPPHLFQMDLLIMSSAGAFSGISPSPNFVITVTDSSSRFFYCSVDVHCALGMVFALNPTVLPPS